MKHYCHAHGCTNTVPPRLLMCGRHWRMVPTDLKTAVLRHYRPGQEQDKNPSEDYLRAAANAINAVAELEGRALRHAGF